MIYQLQTNQFTILYSQLTTFLEITLSATLSTARDQVEIRLQETANLIFSTDSIDEALRASLAEFSGPYGSTQTLSGLDGASSTSFEDQDLNTLIIGAVAYVLRFRLVGKFEEASPIREHPEDLAKWATEFMNEFPSQLITIRLRFFQNADDSPFSQWEWDEGDEFS